MNNEELPEKKKDTGSNILNIIFVVAVCVFCFPYFVIMSLLANRTLYSYIIEVDGYITELLNKD